MKARLKKWMIESVLTLFMGTLVVTGYNLYLQRDMPTGLAPDLQATLLDGSEVDLQQLSKDKLVLLYFWASWCRVCQWVSPAISDISQSGPYEVMTVALSSGTDHRLKTYLQAKDLSFPTINDDDNIISRNWAVSVTPSIFIIKKGEIKSVTTGFTTKAGMQARLLFYSMFD